MILLWTSFTAAFMKLRASFLLFASPSLSSEKPWLTSNENTFALKLRYVALLCVTLNVLDPDH